MAHFVALEFSARNAPPDGLTSGATAVGEQGVLRPK